MLKRVYTIFVLVVLISLSACSVRKDSLKNRAYHNMTSWFNTLFNGQTAMDEKLRQMEDTHKDDYFEILPVEPYGKFEVSDEVEPAEDIIMQAPAKGKGLGALGNLQKGNLLNNESSNATGFEKAEEKALKAIEKHSMMVKGEERNRLIARAYLMLGQARYYKGKPFQAMDALQKVVNLPYDKHDNKAKYFTALSQVQAGNKHAAVSILDELYENEDLKKQLTADVAKQYAWLYLKEGDDASALNGLDKAIKHAKSRKEKARLNYIQGQILTKMGRVDEANAKFTKVKKLNPGFEMEARSVVASALNYDPLVHNYSHFKNRLMKAYRTGTYETYQNEFLYALGEIELKRDSVNLAEKTFKEALSKDMSEPRFRAETYAALGKIKFNASDYVYAGAYYDSAVTTIKEGKRKEELTEFRDALKEVTDKYYLVKRNDSILRLVAMSDSDKESFFNDFIEELKKKDELKRQQEEEASTQFLTRTGDSFSNSFDADGGGKFYFYSNAAKSNGESDFRRIWGNLTLKDNWRLSSAGSSIADQKAELTGTSGLNNPRRYDIDFYLEQIPKTEIAINNLKIERDTVELSLGIDYFDKFKDGKLATNTLEHLIDTPPKEDVIMLKAYYNIYRFNQGKNSRLADKYKNLILTKYPNTIYAEFILNPNVDFTEENNPEVLALYKETYAAYKEDDYLKVRELTQQAIEEYPMAKIMPKFSLLNAYADGALDGKDAYKAALERVVVLYSGTDEAKHAKKLLGLLDNKKKKASPKAKNIQKSSIGKQKGKSKDLKVQKPKKNVNRGMSP